MAHFASWSIKNESQVELFSNEGPFTLQNVTKEIVWHQSHDSLATFIYELGVRTPRDNIRRGFLFWKAVSGLFFCLEWESACLNCNVHCNICVHRTVNDVFT